MKNNIQLIGRKNMNILFKMNENTIRAIDIAQQDLTFDIAMNLLEMKNNKDRKL